MLVPLPFGFDLPVFAVIGVELNGLLAELLCPGDLVEAVCRDPTDLQVRVHRG